MPDEPGVDDARQKLCLDWFGRMVEATQRLTPEEREDLAAWDRSMVTGEGIATSAWPGWSKHIGPPPWQEQPRAAPGAHSGE